MEEWFVLSSIQPRFHSKLPMDADLAVAVFLIITGMMSMLGNGTVLLVYFRKRTKLRPQELMTINLAICDFGFSLLGAPFAIISSLCHAWVFGEAGCLWYGMQGFLFGIGSLLTTCLISLDRCLKICSVRYGQWIERRHVTLAIGLVWLYTLFWSSLPVFGFGKYGPEPFGTSCTIEWWRMRSCLSDGIYILLILMLCFGIPTIIIITSYSAILITVYRSNHMLASIPFSSVSHISNKDLRITKIAAVVCASFLVAWTPYATGSIYSALVLASQDELGYWGHLQTETPGLVFGAGASVVPKLLGVPSLLNRTSAWPGGDGPSSSSGEDWNNASSLVFPSTPDLSPHAAAASALSLALSQRGGPETEDSQGPWILPLVSLIPVMLAKSHCMLNPFIYQTMNPEFRRGARNVLLCRGSRRGLVTEGFTHEGLFSWHSWRRRSNSLDAVEMEGQQGEPGNKPERGGAWSQTVERDALELGSLDTQIDTQRNLEKLEVHT
ncbi:unnamed protein product [Gadus morhua 'NCC']